MDGREIDSPPRIQLKRQAASLLRRSRRRRNTQCHDYEIDKSVKAHLRIESDSCSSEEGKQQQELQQPRKGRTENRANRSGIFIGTKERTVRRRQHASH